MSLEACPYFWGTGASANRNCIVDYQRTKSGDRIAGIPKKCRNAVPHYEPMWDRPSSMRTAITFKDNTCDVKGFWGTDKYCQEICDMDDNEGIGTQIYSYDCVRGDGKYCICDRRKY